MRLGMFSACAWTLSCAGVVVSCASLSDNLAAQLLGMACVLGLPGCAALLQLFQGLASLLLGS